MEKRLRNHASLAILVSTTLLFTLFVNSMDVANAEQEGGFTYTISGGVATVTGYIGAGGDVVIPSTLGGFPTVGIANGAFNGKTNITSITVPDSVSQIGADAFNSCSSLQWATLPSNITAIPHGLFAYCTSLTSLIVPDKVTSIGEAAFFGAASLSSLLLKNNLTSIGDYACAATAIHSMYVPSTVSHIGLCAISGIGADVDPENPFFASVDGVLYDKSLSTLIECPLWKSGDLALPSSVTMIEAYAFNCCSHLRSVGIPSGVTSIGQSAFHSCTALTNIALPSSLTVISNSCFAYCYALTSVEVPDGVATIENGAFFYCISLASVTIGSGVATIKGEVFGECSSLMSIEFEGLIAPTSVDSDWIRDTPGGLRGQANPSSNFPLPGEVWNGLVMGSSTSGLPGVPMNLDATPSYGPSYDQVYLSWNAPADDGGNQITSYRVYRSWNTTSGFSLVAEPITLAYTDTGVEGGQPYWYEVSAVNGVGEGPHAIIFVTTPLNPYVLLRPSAPQNLTYTVSGSNILLAWNPQLSEGDSPITGYRIYRDDILLDQIAALSFNDNTVAAGFSYTYAVSALNMNWEGPKATVRITVWNNKALPSAPLGLTAVPGDGSVSLNWQAPGSSGNGTIQNYRVYRDGCLIASTGSRSCTATGLINEQTYEFCVSAVSEMGEGPMSSPVWSTPIASIPSGFDWHNSSKGYSILIPDGWTAQDDAVVDGKCMDTMITGPALGGVNTNIIVMTVRDPSIKNTQEFLAQLLQDAIDEVEKQLSVSVEMTTSPQYTTISNRSAVVFEYDIAPYNIHQKGAIIVDAEHSAIWTVSCTESIEARPQLDDTFDTIISQFKITSAPEPDSYDMLIILVALIVLAAIIAAIVYIRAKKPSHETVNQAGQAAPQLNSPSMVTVPGTFCSQCGTKLEAGWRFCPVCRKGTATNHQKHDN